MIGKTQKIKKITLVLAILMITLLVGSHFTFALSYEEQGLDKGENAQLKAFAIKWAEAFSKRDAKTIAKLCINDKLYYTIGGVADNGEYFMGVSSPWPWNRDYKIEIVGPSIIEINYYFVTSEPSVYAAKEQIQCKKIEGSYKVIRDSWETFDKIQSKADFDKAYHLDYPDFTKFAEAYQFQADKNDREQRKVFEDPAKAAIYQLNLVGAEIGSIELNQDEKSARVTFIWKDGKKTITMIQPVFVNERGAKRQASIWIAVKEKGFTLFPFLKSVKSILPIQADEIKFY